MLVERNTSVHRIDERDDAVEPVALHQIGMRHHRVQDGGGIRKPRRFDHHAPERGALVILPAQNILKRGDEIAAHRAAEAAAR